MTRQDAMIALLKLPDQPSLAGRRGYHITIPRSAWRDVEVIKRDLGTAYVTHQRQQHTDGDISCVVAVRRLKMVKRA